ncbi:Cytidylate kinase [Candidatus Jidaibacter acanthamoeba]|uniref:Cytidylate kinase n=1 Tax=Candidatus Jidaibacter acanthamoebae TaxID=86105 RepID=A0A0C1MZ49_9RICK|nr:(d)CMP kinase [Candidatus Jidaibacter acanthamoeba]KIE05281.1 Cytidylate kinase [Candidatus Jidaibacter acanthamoeba]
MTVIIAIDGPSASGKGTLSKGLARKLGFDNLDTGSLYRILAYYALEAELASNDAEKIVALVPGIDFSQPKNLILTSDKVSKMASEIASQPKVREALNSMQKNFPLGKAGVVIDGRDIGTVIFPDADCKFFITADLGVRAERRYKQLQSGRKDIIFDQVLQSLKERDELDRNRAIAPTLPADDAIIIDNSDLNADEVLQVVLEKTLETLKHKNININLF